MVSMEMVASNDLMPGDVIFDEVMGHMFNVICIEWQEDCVMIFGYDPILDRKLSIPAPFNYKIGAWARA